MTEQIYIGLDIGGTKTAVLAGTDAGNILERRVVRMDGFSGAREALSEILHMTEELHVKYPARAAGVSCGGPLDSRHGMILSPPNLPGWDEIPITGLLSERLAIPSFLQNDANACALAEWKFGAGRGFRNAIFLTMGTGMGAGLILDGRLYAGTNDMAGEIGHVRMENYGPAGYGKAGSFEGFCSGGGIRRQILSYMDERMQQGDPLPEFEPSAKALAELAQAGEVWAVELYRRIGEQLGRGLSILIDLLNPEVIVIGSIYARSGHLMEDAMRTSVAREALEISRSCCRIVPAELGERIGDVAALCVAMNGVKKDE